MRRNLLRSIGRAAKYGPDMRKPEGSSDYVPPVEGLAYARFVGYFEIGEHDDIREGTTCLTDRVDLVFELSGPNHPPRRLADGTLVPLRITVQETLSLSDKANFFKLFGQMNYAGKATHMAQLLGEPFLVEVFHRKSADGKKVYANLKGPNGYNVRGTSVQDPLSGKTVHIDVDPAITEIKLFVWATADEEDWYDLYIPGQYDEQRDAAGNLITPARSKNVIQERIMSAKNWPQHPLAGVVGCK